MQFISDNLAAIILVLAGLCLLGIVMLQSLQVSRLRVRIDQLTGGADGGDLEAVLGQHLETVHQVGRDLDELTARMAVVESSSRHHYSRAGLVRFNPFPDTGGNQSFALALLDESEDGVIVSSLHSRTGTRIYAKAVATGKADTSLSAEEQDAIDEARAKRPARPSAPPRSAAASRLVAAPAAASADAAPRTAPAAAPARPEKPAPPPMPDPVVRAAGPEPVAPPARVTPPAPAAPRKAAPAPVAKSAPASTTSPSDETTNRPTSERSKGQEKPKELATPETDAAADSERVERKPGQSPAGGPGRR